MGGEEGDVATIGAKVGMEGAGVEEREGGLLKDERHAGGWLGG